MSRFVKANPESAEKSGFGSVFKVPRDSVEKTTKSDSCRKSIPSNVCPCCGQITSRHIYSQRSPRKYPDKVGKLCKKVFEDD